MANLQYVGARYVPKFYENSLDPSSPEWEAGVSYEGFIVVTYLGDSYTSKKPVPGSVGDPAANPEYWAKTADYNAAISALASELAAKTSPAYIQNVMKDVPVNKWFPDNERATGAGLDLNDITFAEVSKQFCNFKNELLVDEWKPYNDAKEFIIHPDLNVTAGAYTFLENGVKVKSPDTSTVNCNINALLYVKSNMCVKFRTFANKGNTTDRCRCGVSFRGRCGIYMENVTKKINYEIDSGSWTPTALSNETFTDAEYLDFMCFVTEHNVSVYVSADGEGYQYIGTTPNSTGTLLGEMRSFIQVENDAVAELTNLKSVYTFLSLADCKYIHYDDTTPYIQDGKAYMTATLQAYGCSITGILRHTLGFNDLELVGIISADGDPDALGTDMCFDRKNKRFITLFRLDMVGGNKIGYAISHNNNLFGIMNFDTTDLPTAASSTDFGNYVSDEDPAICFFNDHWYVAINRIHSAPYIYEVFRTSGSEFDIDDFEYVSTITSASLTGGSFITFNNELYLVAGNGSAITVFNANTGIALGSLGVSVDNRVWGNITVINRGNKTKVYLTTFDRNTVTTSPWSYGAIHMYESTDDIPELVVSNTYSW